ncbi:MAG: Tfx family DNA-binding protein [Candidatus Hadarchaeota archaeon]
MKETFLTRAQQKVLELKKMGMTQAEIARVLQTSRANVSILEKRARENIARAERTVKLAERLRAPVVIKVEAGADLFSIPKLLFKAADRGKIQVKLTAPEIIAKIQRELGDKMRGRSVKDYFEMAVTAEGEVIL